MMTHHRIAGLALLAAAALALAPIGPAPTARADEGMWLINDPPREMLRERYGFSPSEQWLENIQKSCVRLGSGGSGSIVSPDGLLMTNHHVARGQLNKLSTGDRDLIRDGFLARRRADELKLPDLEAMILWEIEDVTQRVADAVDPGMSAAAAGEARKAAIADIESESKRRTALHSEVVTLYGGGLYHLYRYKRFTDIRLVMAPSASIAAFGGDVDNFEFPRYCLDVTFLRVYQNGEPLQAEHFLRFSESGAEDGDLVFVAGHPGRTQRLFTVDHLRFLRDVYYPNWMDRIWRREVQLNVFASESDERARMAERELPGIRNGRKGLGGKLRALQDPRIFAKKLEEQEAFREAIGRRESLQEDASRAFARISAAQRTFADFLDEYLLLESRPLSRSRLFGIARDIVRLVEEREKPNARRLEEYQDSRLPGLKLSLFSPAPIFAPLERDRIESGLALMAERLGGESPHVVRALAGKSPAERARELVDGSNLFDVEARRALVEGGMSVIYQSDDPLIELAMAMDDAARDVRKRHDDEVEAVNQDAYSTLASARFDIYGRDVYPDATFSLRLSIGTVKGFQQEREWIEPFTTFAGLYKRRTSKNAEPPFTLDETWLNARSELDLSTPYNFVSTNDIIGGNSGSPTLNRDGEVVGLIFDGNRYSFVWDTIYTGERGRAVSVDTRAILEALRSVYEAGAIVNELTGAD